MQNPTQKSCKLCAKQFKTKRKWQVFCSRGCRESFHLKELELARELLRKHREKEQE